MVSTCLERLSFYPPLLPGADEAMCPSFPGKGTRGFGRPVTCHPHRKLLLVEARWPELQGRSGNSPLVPIPQGPALTKCSRNSPQRTCPPSLPPHRVLKDRQQGDWGARCHAWGLGGQRRKNIHLPLPPPDRPRPWHSSQRSWPGRALTLGVT